MRIKLSAVIPTTQYGNIQPEFEIDVGTGDAAVAFRQLEDNIQGVWAKYGERPLTINGSELERLTDMFGNEIDYDPIKHEYSWDGVRYMSGSEYAESFRKPFDKNGISDRMAKGDAKKSQELKDQWQLNAEVSRGFGTAIHGALELYERYGKVHNHPILKKAVSGFSEAHKGEKVMNEVLVVDHKAKHAGQIDRLLLVGDKKCRIQDFKTGTTVKDLEIYWKQLEFYRDIVISNGWQVVGLDIFHYDGAWHDYKREEIKLTTNKATADMARATALKETK